MSLSLEPSNSQYDDHGNGENGTIGSRLRKRRRTGSSPTTLPAPRATSSRKPTSPNSKRTPNKVSLREASQDNPQDTTAHNAPKRSPRCVTPISTSDAPLENLVTTESRVNGHAEQPHIPQEAPFKPPAKTRERPTYASVAPDLAAVIARIIDHGEHIDNHYAAQGYDDMGMVDTESFLPLGASLHLKTQSLPILDNLVSYTMTWITFALQETTGDPNFKYISKVHIRRDSHYSH